MDMEGTQRIEAPQDVVWAALNDPDVLKEAIPGCEDLEKVSDTEFKAKVTLKVGPVKATFNGQVSLEDLDPPNGYRIVGEGSGGPAGFAKGGAHVTLVPDGADATLLTYTVHADIGGKIAQLGSRLIDSTAKKLAGQFFTRFGDVVAPPPPGEEGETEGGKKKGWFSFLGGKGKAEDSAEPESA
ncbi:MAG: carbon monoxide dehydrogenase subunit G [Pseudomonadota bacterium]